MYTQFIKTLNCCLMLQVQRNSIILSFKRQYTAESPNNTWTITDTHSYHQFVPTSTYIVPTSTCLDQIKILTYLHCKYDDQCWIGILLDIDKAAGGIKVKFMHQYYSGVSSFQPSRDDICWVPHTHVTTIIQMPLLSSASA